MKKLELMSPAGSLESLYAASRAGADAIYFGGGSFNARRNAKNFTMEELETAIKYLKLRGKRSYITVNTSLRDRELSDLVPFVSFLERAGVSAVIVQDLGVAKMIRENFPNLVLHASTQLTVHNLSGAIAMRELGFSRVVLSRELPLNEIENITKNCGIETEIFTHGALCLCYSGQCYFSALVGGRSGNRGLCAQPCRMQYSFDDEKPTHYLSLKDLCLVDYLKEIERVGVHSAKIEGRMKRPEYTAYVTHIYRKTIDSGLSPSDDEMRKLELIFSRDGFTDGYFKSKLGNDMFGMRVQEDSKALNELYKEAREIYTGNEEPSVPISMSFRAVVGESMKLSAKSGNISANCFADAPEIANFKPTTEEDVKKSLNKTGGTVFYAKKIDIDIEDNLKIPLSVLNSLRRECLEQLELNIMNSNNEENNCEGIDENVQISEISKKDDEANKFENNSAKKDSRDLKYIFSFLKVSQLNRNILAYEPEYIYLPLEECFKNLYELSAYIEKGQKFAAVINRIIFDREVEGIKYQLEAIKNAGINTVVCTNIGHSVMLEGMGFNLRGDYGLNIYNSKALLEYKKMGYKSLTLSFELNFPQIRDIEKSVDTELILYGRLPLMITENNLERHRKDSRQAKSKGVPQNHSLTDKTGRSFPILLENGNRNTIYNSDILFWADKKDQYENLGIAYARLLFTTESSEEIISVIEAYNKNGDYIPANFTRGLYTRGVE